MTERATTDWVSDDSQWSPKAWMSCRDADLVEAVLVETARHSGRRLEVLEWGAGRSTRYFTGLLRSLDLQFRWLSLEYDRTFFDQLVVPQRQDRIRTVAYFDAFNTGRCDTTNTEGEQFCLEYVVFNYGKLLPMLAAHAQDRTVAMGPYVRFPGLLNRRYDIVLVDGRHRRECLLHAAHWLGTQGLVVLHDAHRPYYHCAFETYPWHSFAGDMLWFGSRSAIPLSISTINNARRAKHDNGETRHS